MGNACCGSSEEKAKPSVFLNDGDQDHTVVSDIGDRSANLAKNGVTASDTTAFAQPILSEAEQKQENERLKALREEQARLEVIVQATGRRMAAVRSTRGSTGYYDQGFAAALSQHLEQTTKFAPHIPVNPPPVPSTEQSLYARLSQPMWEGIQLGNEGTGLAGCAGKNPNTVFDHIAESYLDSALPKKERLFAGAAPIVENLL